SKKAQRARKNAPDLRATPPRGGGAYSAARAKRFPADPNADLRQAAEQYHAAMRDVVKQFPDDLDAATLFAEAGMTLPPWGLWHVHGTPEEGTEGIVTTPESGMKPHPTHMGAIHYYIHAVKASPSPQRALAGANKLASLAPAAGHLVHMPGHIYIRTGDYDAAIKTNELAAAADRTYIQAHGGKGMYPAMYYSHNLHFIAACSSMNGNYAETRKAAALLAQHVAPYT